MLIAITHLEPHLLTLSGYLLFNTLVLFALTFLTYGESHPPFPWVPGKFPRMTRAEKRKIMEGWEIHHKIADIVAEQNASSWEILSPSWMMEIGPEEWNKTHFMVNDRHGRLVRIVKILEWK